jgi:hypothetical protein
VTAEAEYEAGTEAQQEGGPRPRVNGVRAARLRQPRRRAMALREDGGWLGCSGEMAAAAGWVLCGGADTGRREDGQSRREERRRGG